MSTVAPDPLQGWDGRLEGERDPIGLPLNSTSIKLENSRIVKQGAGTLYGITGVSNNVAAQFVLGFDLGGVIPSNGAIPSIVIATTAGPSNFFADYGTIGRAFARGIILCNSTTLAALTLGAADTWFDAQYV